MNPVPDDWSRLTLLDHLKRPATYGVVTAGTFVSSGVPMLRGGDIKAGRISTDVPLITHKKDAEYARTRLEAGDVVVALVGYPGESAIVPPRLVGANISRAVGLLRLSGGLRPDYLVHFLNSSMGRSEFLRPGAGSAQMVVNLKDLNKLEVPCPPTAKEQEAIAEALSDADVLIEGLERLIAKKRLIRQGAMQDLLTAKRRLPGFSGEWDRFLIGDFLKFKNGLNKAKSFFGHGTPIVNYMDVFGGGRIDAASIVGLVEVTTEEQSRYGVNDGDILFTRTSEIPEEIGLAAVADGVPEGTVFSGFVLRGRPQNEKLTRNFTKYCFRSEPVRRQIISRATYTTRALTNGRQLSQVEIYAPKDAAEQDAIAFVLIDMDAEIQALDTRLEKTRQVKEGLMQSLLTGRIRLV